MKYIATLLLSLIVTISALYAQDPLSMLEGLEDSTAQSEEGETIATFKGTKVVNFHTIETLGKNTMGFRITHHFGNILGNEPEDVLYNFFGIDGPANVRIALDYSFTRNLMVGLGRTSVNKIFDGYVKYRFLRQTEDNRIPITLAAFAQANIIALRDPSAAATGFDNYGDFVNRFSYVYQIMIARKFGERLSLQLSPTFAHYNLVEANQDANDLWALVGLARFKVSKRSAITAEYSWRINDYAPGAELYDTFSIGWDIETGGHVFQLYFTNSVAINEGQVLRNTRQSWMNGDFRFGFNITRSFYF